MSAKLSFEIDAAKILAKLHCGGCETHAKNGIKYFNSGIVNNAPNLKPEDVDESDITFDMNGTEYELGVVLSDIAIKRVAQDEFTRRCDQILQKQKDKPDDDKKDDKEDDKEDGKNTDKPDSDSSETGEQAQKEKDEIDKKTPITDNPDEQKKSLAEHIIYEADRDVANPDKPADTDDDKSHRKDYADSKATSRLNPGELYVKVLSMSASGQEYDRYIKSAEFKNIPADIQKLMQTTADSIKKQSENLIAVAAVYLTDYLNVFCGPEEKGNEITNKDVKVTYLPSNALDPYKIKKYSNYQIPTMTDEQVRQYKIDWLKKNPEKKEVPVDNMCFKVAYTVDLGK